jgi:Lipase (class 3)
MATIEQTLMTFAAISYAPDADIRAFLAGPPAASPATGWTLAWGPVETTITQGNLVFVAQNAAANQCAIVIRGTYPHFTPALFTDLFQDLTVGIQLPWPYPPTQGAKIAGGTMDGLEEIKGLRDAASGLTLQDLVQQPALARAAIYVTGHSLGGCLATVLAPWLRFALDGARTILPCTFAAPTAGNQAFAAVFTSLFPSAPRYYDTLDVIPMAWANLAAVKSLYAAPGPGCPLALKAAIDVLTVSLKLLQYQQPNGAGNPLTGTPTSSQNFIAEILSQHDSNNYLALLGAPSVPSHTPV